MLIASDHIMSIVWMFDFDTKIMRPTCINTGFPVAYMGATLLQFELSILQIKWIDTNLAPEIPANSVIVSWWTKRSPHPCAKW